MVAQGRDLLAGRGVPDAGGLSSSIAQAVTRALPTVRTVVGGTSGAEQPVERSAARGRTNLQRLSRRFPSVPPGK
jgi:hypothetical protein